MATNLLAVMLLLVLTACEHSPGGELSVQLEALADITLAGPSTGSSLVVARGERIAFAADVSDGEQDWWGAEWYLDGQFLGAQYRHTLAGTTSEQAQFWRGINFPALGRSTVEAQSFDRAGHYSTPVRWDVEVRERPRVLYVDRADERLSNATSRAEIVDLVTRHHFTDVALYRLHRVLPDSALTAALSAFAGELRAAGVARMYAIVGSVADVERVRGYLSGSSASARFDALLTEYEFWRPGSTWRGYLQLLAHARVLADTERLSLATYVGWFDASQAGAIAGLADIVFLHAYVRDPALAYAYLDARLRLLAEDARSPTLVFPIFSAEVVENGGSTQFMGDWLRAHRASDPLESAETQVLRAFRDDLSEHRNGLRLGGFAWYAADHVQAALR